MIDLKNFILAIKSTWIRRLLVDRNAPWVHLAVNILGPLNYITNFGPYWYETLPLKVQTLQKQNLRNIPWISSTLPFGLITK